jgi:hypothetical protein
VIDCSTFGQALTITTEPSSEDFVREGVPWLIV